MKPHDEKMVESIPLSRNQIEDRNGWHFTIMENTRYNHGIK